MASDLQHRIFSFCLNPSSWIDDSHLTTLVTDPEIPESVVRALWRNSNLSKTIFTYYDLSVPSSNEFITFREKLLLLNTEDFQNLTFYMGACVHHGYLRRLINGEEISKAKESMGLDAFDFSTKKVSDFIDDKANVPFVDKDHTFAWGLTIWKKIHFDADPQWLLRIPLKLPVAANVYPTSGDLPELKDIDEFLKELSRATVAINNEWLNFDSN